MNNKHQQYVKCHVLCFTFYFFSFIIFFYTVIELVGGGSVINGVCPVLFTFACIATKSPILKKKNKRKSKNTYFSTKKSVFLWFRSNSLCHFQNISLAFWFPLNVHEISLQSVSPFHTDLYKAVPYSTLRFRLVIYSAVMDSALQCLTVKCSTVQCCL